MGDIERRKRRLRLPLIVLAIPAVLVGCLFGLRKLTQYQMYCDARDRMASQIEAVKRGKSLRLSNIDPRFIDMIFAEPDCVKRVEELQFTMQEVADERLGRLKALPNVTYIYFYSSHGTDTFFKNTAGMESLEEIQFEATDLSAAGIRYLAAFPNLKSLSLGYAEITTPVLRELKNLQSLEELTLYDTTIGGSELEELKCLSQLKKLDLSAESGDMKELQKALPDCKID